MWKRKRAQYLERAKATAKAAEEERKATGAPPKIVTSMVVLHPAEERMIGPFTEENLRAHDMVYHPRFQAYPDGPEIQSCWRKKSTTIYTYTRSSLSEFEALEG